MARKKRIKPTTIDGPTGSDRQVRKGVHLSEQTAFNLTAIAAMSRLNGKRWTESAIVEEALVLWFSDNGFASERFMKLTMK